MGYIRQPSIESQIETNTYLDIICQDVKDMHSNLDTIVNVLNNYTDTGKLNELDYPYQSGSSSRHLRGYL